VSTRTRIKIGKKSHYAVRNKKGQFKDIQNIGRSIRMDAARKSKRKVKGKGKGHLGDYAKKRKSAKSKAKKRR
jgi:hypothetical protein